MKTRNPFALLGAAVLAPSLALADVHVVDITGAGEYLDIPSAVAASVDGDLILVRPGTYGGGITITGLDLVVTAEDPAATTLAGGVTVRDVPFGKSAVVAGFRVTGALDVSGNTGVVVLEDCRFPRRLGLVSTPGISFNQFGDCGIGISDRTVTTSSAVVLTACYLEGANAGATVWDGYPGWHALQVSGSHVALYDCVLVGGDGADTPVGGHPPTHAGAGGDGVRVLGAGSTLRMARTAAIGGNAGVDTQSNFYHGCPGEGVRADVGSVVEEAAHPDLALRTPSVLVGGVPGTVEVEGPPGATVLLLHADRSHLRPLGPVVGSLLLGGDLRIVPIGTIPAGGVLIQSVTGADPATPEDHTDIRYQVVAFQPTGRFLSEARVVPLVHSSL